MNTYTGKPYQIIIETFSNDIRDCLDRNPEFEKAILLAKRGLLSLPHTKQEIAESLKVTRQLRGFTKSQLAERIGVKRKKLARWENTNKAIGQLLANLRRRHGLTQFEFARAMQTDSMTISRWERGRSAMSAVNLLEANLLLQGELLRALQWE